MSGKVSRACPYRKLHPLAQSRESGDAPSHGRYAQTDLVGSHRAVPIKGFARGGDPDTAPSAHCAAKKIAEAARLQQFRSSGFCQPLSDCTAHCACLGDRKAGDCYPRHRAGFVRFGDGSRDLAAADRRCRSKSSLANPLRGAPPELHGELLKLGIDVGQTSVAKYMARHRRPPSQGWKTFLRNHADGIASMDLFVVPTLSFRLLYGLLILRPPPNLMAGRDGAPGRRMDCPPTNRSPRLGMEPKLRCPRS